MADLILRSGIYLKPTWNTNGTEGPGCKGCPFFADGVGFTPDEMVDEAAEIMVFGQNPGKDEEFGQEVMGYDDRGAPIYRQVTPRPYIGPTGYAMENNFFPKAGLERGKVHIGNAIRCRAPAYPGGPHTNDLPNLQAVDCRKAIEHCQRAHGRVPEAVKLIIAEGEYALWATTQEGMGKNNTISSWRGYLLPYNPPPRPSLIHTDIFTPKPTERKVLAVYHLAYLTRSPWERPTMVADWDKVGRILRGSWPLEMPEIHSLGPASFGPLVSFDTEFTMDASKRLLRYSAAQRRTSPLAKDRAWVWCVEAEDIHPVAVPELAHVVMQNVDADIVFWNQVTGGAPAVVEDTMYAHSVRWPDLDHDLNYGGSMYASINRWKHLAQTNPRLYSGADALGTLDWWESLVAEFASDPQSLWVYENCQRPLLGIIARARSVGIRVNHGAVEQALTKLEGSMSEAAYRAQAVVGWPINLASVGPSGQVPWWLYKVDQIDVNPISGRKRR